jgi:hypothetical protein
MTVPLLDKVTLLSCAAMMAVMTVWTQNNEQQQHQKIEVASCGMVASHRGFMAEGEDAVR